MKIILVIVVFAGFSTFGFSAIMGSAKVEGIIVSYNKHTVTLSQKGKRVKVPKKAIPSFFKIKTGNKVYAVFDSQEVMAKLKAAQNKEKHRPKATKPPH